jgi:hypothetical protein
MRSIEAQAVVLALVMSGCGGAAVPPSAVDAGVSDLGGSDTGPIEPLDVGSRVDVVPPDAGTLDVNRVDVRDAMVEEDANRLDVSEVGDAGRVDVTDGSSPPDLPVLDAGTPDVGTPDVGTPDAGTPDAGTPDAGTPIVDLPVEATTRLRLPPSGSRVTSRRPTFRWVLGVGTMGARVEVCRDRACATVVAAFDVTGTSGAAAADLPTGALFWRVLPRTAAGATTAATAPWSFTVGPRSAAVSTASGSALDVNGDGYRDLVVAANGPSGRVAVYLGGAGAFDPTPDAFLEGPDGETELLANEVASAGDVNGDGYGDLLIGSVPGTFYGTDHIRVYLGGPGGLAANGTVVPTPSATPFGSRPTPSFAGAGDLNGDGYADFALGDLFTLGSAVYVFFGGAGAPPTTPVMTLRGAGGGDLFGSAILFAGDLDHDGYDELVVGASGVLMSAETGSVFVFPGRAGGPAATPSLVITGGDGPGSAFGFSIASALRRRSVPPA